MPPTTSLMSEVGIFLRDFCTILVAAIGIGAEIVAMFYRLFQLGF